jgi:hypothetical protein
MKDAGDIYLDPVREMILAAKQPSHLSSPVGTPKARDPAATKLARFVLSRGEPMSGPQDHRPIVTDSAPDRSAAESAEKAAFRAKPEAPPAVEPHWEPVIAAATD